MAFDERLLRVGIEVEGQVRIFEGNPQDGSTGFDIRVKGDKFGSLTQNETEVSITNLDQPTRDFLLTEGTPFNRLRNRVRNRIFIEAGRVSTGYHRVFEGDITTTSVSQPPDIITTIRALTNQFQKGEIVSAQALPMATLNDIAQSTADSLGVRLEFLSENNPQISNYQYNGSVAGQVNKLGSLVSGDVYVDDDTLVVKDATQSLPGRNRVLNLDNGLIGIPQFQEFGIAVTYFFDSFSTVGTQLELQSTIYPATNGLYTIYKLSFDLASRDTPFYYQAEARRVG